MVKRIKTELNVCNRLKTTNKAHRERLIKETFNKAEYSLNISLSDVQLNRRSTEALNAVAATNGAQVTLAHELDYSSDSVFQFVLAHELAHVAQKKLNSNSKESSPSQILEEEADLAALSILSNNRYSVQFCDRPERTAYYNSLGHFYTVYYIMRMADIDHATAEKRAFMCQLPDEVFEFDACAATRDSYEPAPYDSDYNNTFANDLLTRVGENLRIQRSTPLGSFKYDQEVIIGADTCELVVKENPETQRARLKQNQAAIRGLHCLTDEGSAYETRYRLQAVKKHWEDPVLSGLALHPFGDSYSHRVIGEEDVMYGPGIGHAAHGHAPDYVRMRPKLYLQYCKTFYEAIRPNTRSKDFEFKDYLEPSLNAVLGISDDEPSRPGLPPVKKRPVIDGEAGEEQAEKVMMELLESINTPFNNLYQPIPHGESQLYWKTFSTSGRAADLLQALGGADKIYKQVMAAGARWRDRKPH